MKRKKIRLIEVFCQSYLKRQVANNGDMAICSSGSSLQGKAVQIEMSSKQLKIQVWSLSEKSDLEIHLSWSKTEMVFKSMRQAPIIKGVNTGRECQGSGL